MKGAMDVDGGRDRQMAGGREGSTERWMEGRRDELRSRWRPDGIGSAC